MRDRMAAMVVNGLTLVLLLICVHLVQCSVCTMKSMEKTPMCRKSQDKEHHVSIDSAKTWDQVSDPASAEDKNIGSANVSGVSGDGWDGLSNDSVVEDNETTVYQDMFGLDLRGNGSGFEQQDPPNSTDWSINPDRGNMTSRDNVMTRKRVFRCPQLSWKGLGVTLAISVGALAAFCSVSCAAWDCAVWCRGDCGKPENGESLCYHCRRIWWMCTVPRGQQRKWRVIQNRKWRERNVLTQQGQVMPAPIQRSGVCDNGFQEIELEAMG